MVLLRSLLFSLFFYPFSTFPVLAAFLSVPLGRDAVIGSSRRWARFHRFCARYILGIRSRVEGRLPQGPVLVAIKHESMFETVETLALFDRPAVVLKRELLDIPFWGFVARTHGVIPVDRGTGAAAMRAMMKSAREAIAEGRPIIIFPEGTRVPHGEAPAIKAGFAGLYRILGVPVVPIALDSGRLWPRRSLLKRSGFVTWRVGETIPAGLDRSEAEARVHAAINALNDEAGR
jgi:1-acyl-sn-glycerol-3-phosphate acyltransferase